MRSKKRIAIWCQHIAFIIGIILAFCVMDFFIDHFLTPSVVGSAERSSFLMLENFTIAFHDRQRDGYQRFSGKELNIDQGGSTSVFVVEPLACLISSPAFCLKSRSAVLYSLSSGSPKVEFSGEVFFFSNNPTEDVLYR